MDEPILGLAIAVLVGGFLQLAVQIPVFMKKGFRFRPIIELHHPATKRIGKLLVPRAIGSSIYQLNVFADTIFASFGTIVGNGAVAALYYANRLIQFPTAIFGVALATACLPTMSQQAVANDMEKLKSTLVFSIRLLLFVLIPSTIGLFVLAKPIVEVLFERGQFDLGATNMTAIALMFYCVGIFSYSGARLTTSCFYSLKDTVTPVKVTGICLLINILLNVTLMYPLKVGGLALATALSSMANFFILLYLLRRKIGSLGIAQTLKIAAPVFFASLLMGAACKFTYLMFGNYYPGWMSLGASIVLGTVVFLICSYFLGIFKNLHFKYGSDK